MRSSYKRIGGFVQQVNVRNSGLSVTNLQGVSINKYFMPSVANVNGTDLSTYKVVYKDQFAFNPMHVGRDEVLPIAVLETDAPVIVTPAYVVFEITDKLALLPEYLMMWCRRPEFDRNACFTTDSSVRGGFSWDNFCEMRLPVPSPEKQREIVREYHTIVDRIKLNERLNQKLEETAQAIYKRWFVDFEFPISAEYAAAIGKPELEGQQYKSSGGEMVYNDVLKQEIPKGWKSAELGDLVTTQYGFTASAISENVGPKLLRITDITNDLIWWDTVPYCEIPKSKIKAYALKTGDIVVARTGATVGYAKRINKKHPKCIFASYLVRMVVKDISHDYYVGTTVISKIYRDYIQNSAEGSGQEQGNAPLLRGFKLVVPEKSEILGFKHYAEPLIDVAELHQNENALLRNVLDLLLSRIVTVKE